MTGVLFLIFEPSKNMPCIVGWREYYSQANFSFLFLIANISVASQILHDGRCLHAIHSYFCWSFRCTNLSIVKVGNTVISNSLVTAEMFFKYLKSNFTGPAGFRQLRAKSRNRREFFTKNTSRGVLRKLWHLKYRYNYLRV